MTICNVYVFTALHLGLNLVYDPPLGMHYTFF